MIDDILTITINGDQTLSLDLGSIQQDDSIDTLETDIPLPRIEWTVNETCNVMHIANIKDICASVHRSAKEVAKYINIEIGKKTRVKKLNLIIEFQDTTDILDNAPTDAPIGINAGIIQKTREIVDIIDDYHSQFVHCPYCERHSTSYIKHQGKLRILCKDCKRTAQVHSHKLVKSILKGIPDIAAKPKKAKKKKLSEAEHEAMLLDKIVHEFNKIEEITMSMTESVSSLDGWSPDSEDAVQQRKQDYYGDNEVLSKMFF